MIDVGTLIAFTARAFGRRLGVKVDDDGEGDPAIVTREGAPSDAIR